jgi:cell division transport system ATP-binding protein
MISIRNVTKQYKGAPRASLDDVSIEIDKGDFVFLVGTSGSGKSSLLRLMLREDVPSKGSVSVLGENLVAIASRRIPQFRRNIGMVFQDFRLLPNKTIFENIAFSLEVTGASRSKIADKVPAALNLVGLSEKADRMPNELSGGEQQRVALARAFVDTPALLLADEPTGNLDPATSAEIMRLLEKINEGGTTIVMATHDRGLVDLAQKRVVVLDQGRIVRDERGSGYVGQE